MTDKIKRLQERIKKLENIERFATKTIEKQSAEIEKLNVELVGMRGACESYRIHYDVAQAEIERLKEEIRILQYCNNVNISSSAELHDRLRTAKSEAIKEFAERLKKQKQWGVDINDYVFVYVIEDLVKEMTEVGE